MDRDEHIVWSRLRGRILANLPGTYEEAARLAEHLTTEILTAPELVVTPGEWPTPDPETTHAD